MADLREFSSPSKASSSHWYALRCKSNMEFIVDSQLNAQKIPRYLPLYAADRVNPRSRAVKPYFPGYLFVQESPERLYALRVFLMRGVVGLVHFDGVPATIQPNLIEEIRRQTGRLNAERNHNRSGFEAGDEILLDNRAFGQMEGIFERCVNGTERVLVLLKMMRGSMLRMELPAEMIRRKPKTNN